MSLNPAVMRRLLLAAALGIVTPIHAQKTPTPPSEEKEPSLTGLVLERDGGGGFLNLRVEEGKFRLYFLDAKKQPIAPLFPAGNVRFRPSGREEERTALNLSEDGKYLTGPKFVRPPYILKVYLSVFDPTDPARAETYTGDYKG